MSALTYKMMAKRDNETIKSERSSAYMILSKARVWVSEGWTVTITDPDGKTLAVSEFESRVSEQHPLPASTQDTAIETAIAPDAPMASETVMAADADAAVTDESDAGADTLVTV
jgi:hypothetical protein